MLIALSITIAAVRLRRADLAGAQTTPAASEASAEMAEAGQSGRAGPRG